MSVKKSQESELNLPRDVLTVLLSNRDKHDLDDKMIIREVAFFSSGYPAQRML